jgi:dipeptidyl aminopeptidase/acylaminoacyl peptidase
VIALALAALALAAGPAADGRIAFTRIGFDHASLYAVAPDGSGLAPLTGTAGPDETGAAWSPDGTQLAYLAGNVGRRWTVTVAGADGSAPRALVQSRALTNGPIAWSPDGARLAFARAALDGFQLYTAAAAGGVATRLTSFTFAFVDGPAWSPDGTTIVFRHDTNTASGPTRLWAIAPDGSDPRPLTSFPASEPDWSPDGSRIAITRTGVWTIAADGGDPRQLTASGSDPSWSPDGTRLVFSDRRGSGTELYVVNADGTCETRITDTRAPGTHALEPDWGPGGGAVGPAACADPAVELAEAPRLGAVGRPAPYVFRVRNDGNLPAEGVELLADLSTRAALAGAGGCSGTRAVVCPLGTLGPGATVDVRLVLRPLRTGGLKLAVRLKAATPQPPADDDTATAETLVYTRLGTPGADYLRGTPGDDLIPGFAGDDVIVGGAGNDVLDGGRGRDRVDGGAGADSFYVADGARDVVRGGPGEDRALADRVDRIVGVEHVVAGSFN